MDTFVFESQQGEVQITVVAADRARAERELDWRITQVQELGVIINSENFVLVSAY